MSETIKLTKEQLGKCRHMLGLSYKSYTFRNRYCSGELPDKDLDEMVALGLLDRGAFWGGIFYRVNPKGWELLKVIFGNFEKEEIFD